VWEDQAILHKPQQGIFPLGLSAIEGDRVSHRNNKDLLGKRLVILCVTKRNEMHRSKARSKSFFSAASVRGAWTFWSAKDTLYVAQPILVDWYVSIDCHLCFVI
jgi:hypothetical protein